MKALILIDIQNDFLPGGALPVPEGNEIIPIVQSLLKHPFELIIATKDWHPKEHSSFAVNQGKMPGEIVKLGNIEQVLWPVHCVQNTFGAEFAPGWDTNKISKIIYKGTDKSIDSYSSFFDNQHKQSTGLEDFLRKNNIQELFIAGLATDYCVKFSALDALNLGFQVHIISDACRGINISPEDSAKTLKDLQAKGAIITTSTELINRGSYNHQLE